MKSDLIYHICILLIFFNIIQISYMYISSIEDWKILNIMYIHISYFDSLLSGGI